MHTEIVNSTQRYDFYNDIQTEQYKAHDDEVASTQKEQEGEVCLQLVTLVCGRLLGEPFLLVNIHCLYAGGECGVVSKTGSSKKITEGLNRLNNQGTGNGTLCQSDELA